MPVLDSSVAPLIVIAPRGASSRAIRDDDVVRDEAIEIKHAYKYGPGHTASAKDINLLAFARRMQSAGGSRLESLKKIRTRYQNV